MRRAILTAAALLTAGAALAAPPPEGTTLAYVLARGTILKANGQEIQMTFKPDGTFDGGGQFGGTYTVDGKKLCIEVQEFSIVSCTEYPEGKKPGDAFTLETNMGPTEIKIR